MKQTDKQFMALVGHDIFFDEYLGNFGKSKS